MKFSEAACIKVIANGKPVFTQMAPITGRDYFAAIHASAKAEHRGVDTVIEMTDTAGNVQTSSPWEEIKRSFE